MTALEGLREALTSLEREIHYHGSNKNWDKVKHYEEAYEAVASVYVKIKAKEENIE